MENKPKVTVLINHLQSHTVEGEWSRDSRAELLFPENNNFRFQLVNHHAGLGAEILQQSEEIMQLRLGITDEDNIIRIKQNTRERPLVPVPRNKVGEMVDKDTKQRGAQRAPLLNTDLRIKRIRKSLSSPDA